MATWPGSLPQNALIVGWGEKADPQNLRSQMDVGPSKSRRRSTTKIVKTTWPIFVTEAQRTTLETFYDTTLEGGSLSFDHVHPVTGAAITCKFTEELDFSQYVYPKFRVPMKIEILP